MGVYTLDRNVLMRIHIQHPAAEVNQMGYTAPARLNSSEDVCYFQLPTSDWSLVANAAEISAFATPVIPMIFTVETGRSEDAG
jgi:hypothetical protein